MQAVRDNIVAWRHALFGGASGDGDWIFTSENLTGASAKMQLRYAAGDTGTALVTLNIATAGSQGLSITYDAAYLDPETGLTVGGSTVRPQIDKATLEGITPPVDPTQPLVLAYDLHVTPSGGVEQVRVYGTFTINPGVTI